jgi:hypothetical protein
MHSDDPDLAVARGNLNTACNSPHPKASTFLHVIVAADLLQLTAGLKPSPAVGVVMV